MNSQRIYTGIFSSLLTLFVVAGCGGGGGGGSGGPVASTLSFPLLSALQTQTANGGTTSLTANGTAATQTTDGLCSGSLSETTGAASGGATFEGASAFSSVTVLTLSFSNCTPSSISSTSTSYYDSNFFPLGFNVQGGDYGVNLVPFSIPNSVMVGDVGIVGTSTLYTNSTKAVGNGRADWSFVIEPDTANTAIVNLITKQYNAASQLLFTEQDRYRITSNGALTTISVDIQYATTPTVRLVFK
jgi:hypothetical protein